MLPGFRFLVAAIVCSISLTIFGMGAAALLRAAHEQFASNSSWRSTQASGFTTFLPPAEPTPVLAMLRVESAPAQLLPPPSALVGAAPATDEQPILPPASGPVAAAVAEKVDLMPAVEAPALPTPSLPAETVDMSVASIAILTVAAPVERSEAAKPDRAIAATVEKASDKLRMDALLETAAPAPPPASIVVAVVPAVATPAPQMLASADPTMAPAALPSPAAAPTAAVLDPIAAKLAALAEQPTHQDRPAASEHRASVKVASVQLRRSVLKKRQAREKEKQVAARRAKQRRYAERARAARQVAAQQQQQAFPDPFGQQPFAQAPAIGQQQAAGPRTR
jgi:hypothetical protein